MILPNKHNTSCKQVCTCKLAPKGNSYTKKYHIIYLYPNLATIPLCQVKQTSSATKENVAILITHRHH